MKAQRTRPVIGINADFVAATKQTNAYARLHAGYFDSILSAGGLPVIMPPLGKKVEINAFLEQVDGFVLSGGLDLDPKRHATMPVAHSSIQPMPERRESHDRLLVDCLSLRRTPVLAIGVGMQLVNVLAGGSLYVHLPMELPRAMPHRDPHSGAHRHLVLLEPDTRLLDIYGGVELRVNSEHHQAVREIGDGFRLAAKSPDGVIEAIESTDPDWFCICVQWHPESDTASALDTQLFECFMQACDRQVDVVPMAA